MSESLENARATLRVTAEASAEQVRSAYLNLVRQHPPDQDAEQFRQIHAAYQLLSDPLTQADALMTPAGPPDLMKVVEAAEQQRPRLETLALLSLGNVTAGKQGKA
jgi:DnaJ-domain-containing protein 1